LGLIGCAAQKVAVPAALSDGSPTPIALGEAIALGMNLSTGTTIQEAKDFGFASEMVYALSGKPLNHLVLVGPKPSGFWQALSNPVDNSSYTAYAIGATDKRVFFSMILPSKRRPHGPLSLLPIKAAPS
jgi:hypothetical protein